MKYYFKDQIVIIPLHIQKNFPADYVEQTATTLSKRNTVIIFDFQNPLSWKNSFRQFSLREILSYPLAIVSRKKTVLYFRPLSLFPFQKLEFMYRANVSAGILMLKLALSILKEKPVIWGFNPIMVACVGKLGESMIIYDCIDYYGNRKTANLVTHERQLMKVATYVIFNSLHLQLQKQSEYPDIRSRSTHVVCGCNTSLFKHPLSLKRAREYIVFVGHIDYWIHLPLFRYIVRSNPSIPFKIVGPIDETMKYALSDLLTYSNVTFTGRVSKNKLPEILRNASVGIIPYDTEYTEIRYCNPMKTYEYLAMGIPVVATNILALTNIPNEILQTTSMKREFNRALRTFHTNWSLKQANKAINFAHTQNWNRKIAQIDTFVKKQRI